MQIRPAQDADLEPLAALWFAGWHDAHAGLFPDELVRLRTLNNFRDRLRANLATVHVAGPPGEPAGFYLLKADELDQFFVAATHRGSGLAARLMADAEARLGESFPEAWLVCAIGNHRAARFYEKSGWRRTGVVEFLSETAEGPYAADVWRYEKRLAKPGR